MISGDMYADSAVLNSWDGSSLERVGFRGVIPYVGIGGGSGLPNKRLTRDRYLDFVSVGLDVPAVFVELGSYDADGGYNAGVANAQAAMADLIQLGISDVFVIAVNDKTGWVQADIDYVRGFVKVWGSFAGVYGFSSFLEAVWSLVPGIRWFHQCGDRPDKTGTDDFVNVWQDNTRKISNLDVNIIRKVPIMTNPLDESITRYGIKPDGSAEVGSTTLRSVVAWSDFQWDRVNSKLDGIHEEMSNLPAGGPVTFTDAQIGLLGTAIVDALFKRLNGTAP